MVGHGGSSAGSYLTDPTSPIPSHCASIVATSTVRINIASRTEIMQVVFPGGSFWVVVLVIVVLLQILIMHECRVID